ncbi:FAD-dependent oxidoreductase [Verrucomicrobium sp. BvORR106]|uniref:FAD-dependent oxidoreductase n=1 Tax=Verrucomicrobium sp. BvORR106 TaxID=1403819 RepID=UPI00056EB963|nr:FAD-dependent oxidoreductase [Verrucomicrobium sp. BvORR106]
MILSSVPLRLIPLLAASAFGLTGATAATYEYDVVVYGGSPAGIAASIQAARMGRKVALIEPSRHLGGQLTNGGTVMEPKYSHLVGGIAREFHHRIWSWYTDDAHWTFQKRDSFAGFSPATSEPDNQRMWTCEPHVAGRVLDDMLREARVHVILGRSLNAKDGVAKEERRLTSIHLGGDDVYAGKVFLDASHDGQLMAQAGVTFRTGREANVTYGETLNGIRPVDAEGKWAKWNLDAHVIEGDAKSPLLPGVAASAAGEAGADSPAPPTATLALCVTKEAANRLPWPKPEKYDLADYELLVRVAGKLDAKSLFHLEPLPNGKARLVPGLELAPLFNTAPAELPSADRQTNRTNTRRQREHLMGLFWTLANDERVPEPIRKRLQEWGLCRDEWRDQGSWPSSTSVPGIRRLVGTLVLTEKHLRGEESSGDPVGMNFGSAQWSPSLPFATKEGRIAIEAPTKLDFPPQPVGFQALLPKPEECTNLLVPVCVSASHVAEAAFRNEVVLMVLGQSAGTAAALAVEHKVDVAELEYSLLRSRLVADGQVLEDELLRQEVHQKVTREKAAAETVLSELDRKTQERSNARAAAQEKRKQQEAGR